jgi:hypothetical protein
VESILSLQDRDRTRLQAAKLFLRKHAAVIKKNMLLESINYRFRKTSEEKSGKNQNGKDGGSADSKEEAT